MELCQTAQKQTLDLAGALPSHPAGGGLCHRPSPSAIAAGKPACNCGTPFPRLTRKPTVLPTSGKRIPRSSPKTNSPRATPKRAPNISNASTALCARDWDAWCAKLSPFPKPTRCTKLFSPSFCTPTIAQNSLLEPLPKFAGGQMVGK